MLTLENVHHRHKKKKEEILGRLAEFSLIKKQGDEVLLSELTFCICAANSSAAAAHKAQLALTSNKLLFSDDTSAISAILLSSHVRFHKNKARYIIEARKKMFDEKGLEKAISTSKNQTELRNFLADEVLGLGMKEAGHFMRNTGLGNEVAILDRHILKNLVSLGVIKQLPPTLTRKRYLEIEKQMAEFSAESGIPLSHLDLLMWSEMTGRIFK